MTTEERLEKLERELSSSRTHNRLLLSGAAIIGVFVSLCACHSTQPDAQDTARVIRAERFELVDANGKARGGLVVGKESAGLSLLDERGKLRAMLTVDKSGSGVSLLDANGLTRASLMESEGTDTFLDLRDGSGKAGLWMHVDDLSAGVSLNDTSTKKAVMLAVTKLTGPVIQLDDENGKEIWSAPNK